MTDERSRAIEGVLVLVHPFDGREELFQPAHTDADGRFLIMDLPPNRYVVTAYFAGEPYERELAIESGRSSRIDFGPLPLPASEPWIPSTSTTPPRLR